MAKEDFKAKNVMARMKALGDATAKSSAIGTGPGRDTGLTSTKKGFSASFFMRQNPTQTAPVARLPQPIQMAVDVNARFDAIQRKQDV